MNIHSHGSTYCQFERSLSAATWLLLEETELTGNTSTGIIKTYSSLSLLLQMNVWSYIKPAPVWYHSSTPISLHISFPYVSQSCRHLLIPISNKVSWLEHFMMVEVWVLNNTAGKTKELLNLELIHVCLYVRFDFIKLFKELLK